MDYKKSYEDAIVGIKEVYNQADAATKAALEARFPELAESEDERIRKELIGHLKECRNNTRSEVMLGTYAKWITYIEKQKEQPTNEEMLRTLRTEYEKGVADTIAKYEQKEQKPNPYTGTGFDYNGHHWGMCVRDGGVEIIVDGKIKDRVFFESKSIEYNDSVAKEMFIKALERAVEQTKKGYELTDCDKHSWWEDFKVYSEINSAEWSEDKRIEKQKEQKSVLCVTKAFYEPGGQQFDVVEDKNENDAIVSKFNIGDKIRFKGYGANEYTISSVLHGYYINTDGNRMDMSYTDANFELIGAEQESAEWSKEDEGMINCIISTLCEESHGGRETNERMVNWLEKLRKFLTERVNLQLKQEWSEEDEKMIKVLESIIRYIVEVVDKDVLERFGTNYEELFSWFKFFRSQPKQEWSEEDEKILNSILGDIGIADKKMGGAPTYVTKRNWLESLRPQLYWKPSEEQMEALKFVIEYHHFGSPIKKEQVKSIYDNLQKLCSSDHVVAEGTGAHAEGMFGSIETNEE